MVAPARMLALGRGLILGGLALLLGHKGGGRGIELHRGTLAHGLGELARMHDDHAAGARLYKVDHLGVGESGDVVHDGGAAAHGRLGDLNMARVDGDDGALLGERAHHGQHATGLLIGVDRRKAGTRGLAAHVDDVGTLVEHLEAVLDRRIGIEMLAAVAERIGRDVEDTHDARAVEPKLVLAAAPDLGILSSHVRPFALPCRTAPAESRERIRPAACAEM